MTGTQMLLKQLGLDPVKVQATYEQITAQLPVFLNQLGAKVVEMDATLKRIEANQQIMLEKLGVTNGTESTAVTVTGTNGAVSRNGN